MAELNEKIFEQQPYFLHYNLKDFENIFYGNRDRILRLGSSYLKASIYYQEQKESYIYELLNLKPGNWKEIGDRLYGVFEGEGEDAKLIRKNRLESFLKSFTDFFNKYVFSEVSTRSFSGKELSTKISNGETFGDIAQKFINAYNEPVEEFLSWYNKSDLKNKDKIEEKDIQFLNDIFKTYREKGSNSPLLDKDGKIRDVQSIGENNAMELLRKSTGILNNLIGAIGEQATISLRGNLKNHIINTIATSDFNKDIDEDSDTGDIKRDKLLEKNVTFYREREEKINSVLKNKIKLASKDGGLIFGLTYSEKDTDTLRKNLKADEIFNFKIEATGEIINYGISSKTSWGTSKSDLKLYSGSLQSAFENMFKGLSNVASVAGTATIINFLQYSILNAGGAGYYGGRANKTAVSREVKDVYEKIIDYYAFQWFTGGISEATHADFFSVYGNGHHYFIPMSVILKKILESKKPLLNQTFYKTIEEDLGSYISEEEYNGLNNFTNEDMQNKGREIFNNGVLKAKREVKEQINGKIITKTEIYSKTSGEIKLSKEKMIKKVGLV